MIAVFRSWHIGQLSTLVKNTFAGLANRNVDSLRWRHVALLVVFILLTGNLSFYHQLTIIYPLNLDFFTFVVSLGVLVSSLILLLYCGLRLIMGARLAAVLLLLLTSCSAFFTDQFGIVMDYTMVGNFIQSDRQEMQGLLSTSFFTALMLYGVLPAIIVLRLPVLEVSRLHEWRRSGFLVGSSLLVIIACLVSFSPFYANFFREHKAVRYYVNPVNPVFAISKYAVREIEQLKPTNLQPILKDAAQGASYVPKLVVMVVGETARSDRFSLNGYQRDTNPMLSIEPGIQSYANVQSCGTSTAISVPCMFASVGKDDFTSRSIQESENILDVLQRTGVSVLWRDNNSDSKGVALRVPFEDFRSQELNKICDSECRDVGMLEGLQPYIDGQEEGDILIVLHQMGNHGPAYFKRYPAEFEHFTPACHSKELSSCTKAEIDNAYDNAIRYTDFFLSEVISLLKKNTETYDTTMFYVSDHGESLGELGVYLHGMPYLIAPEEQRSVPVIVWEDSANESYGIDESLQSRSHDAVFKSLLMTFGIQNVSSVEGQSFLAGRINESATGLAYNEE